ncbi:MAG: hypothetical protein IPH13_16765 [Planctomycetes bacterium]|nr:hypothetical protein [Planctomycetota bacterium]MCC7169312.1 hypothetical protein [Planctomycetota bacterium]
MGLALVLGPGVATARPTVRQDDSASPRSASIEALEAVIEQPFAHADAALLTRTWQNGSPAERLAAAILELRAEPTPERVELVRDFARRAAITDVRRLVDAAPRPLASGFAPLVAELADRPHVAATELAADLAAALERPAAQQALLDLARSSGSAAVERDRAPIWTALAAVGDEVAAAAVIGDLNEPGSLGTTARAAVLAIADRTLSQARIADGVALLAAAARAAPRDRGMALRHAAGLGLYLDRRDDARAILNDLLARASVDMRSPTFAKDEADARLGLASLAVLDGDLGTAAAEIERAIVRFGEPREHRRERKVVRCRLELMKALVALRAGQPTQAAATIERAILHAPYEQDYCTFDDALTGPFGPAALLDLLRRLGQGEFAVEFFVALTDALSRVASTSTIRIGLVAIAGPMNGPEASDDRSRVKSWQHLRYVEALLAVGRSTEAEAHATRDLARLDGTEPWVNRWLEAELQIARARALVDLGRPDEAARSLESAASTLRQLGELSILAEIEDVHDRALDGAPPLRSPVRDREAVARVFRARVERNAGSEAAARAALVAAWKVDPMSDDVVVQSAAWSTDAALATRVLATIAPTGANLVGLARVAAAHGRVDDAMTWLERLDGWNACVPQRAALDRAAFSRDADFTALRSIERFRGFVGDTP